MGIAALIALGLAVVAFVIIMGLAGKRSAQNRRTGQTGRRDGE
jgi:hypothetical protein